MRPAWLVMICLLAAVSCADAGFSAPEYEARTCSWSERLREQCVRSASASLDPGCTPALAERFALEHGRYAECIAHGTELHARCLEGTLCDARSDDCRIDLRMDCGPVPAELAAEMAACLPRYRCQLGQEVSLDRRCDGTFDCFDHSDEEGSDG